MQNIPITNKLIKTCKTNNLRRRENRKAKFWLLAIIYRQTLKKQGPQTRASATTNSIEYQKSLQSSAVVCQLTNSIKAQINDIFANCSYYFGNVLKMTWQSWGLETLKNLMLKKFTRVMSSGKVVCRILLSRNELLRMKELSICPSPNFIDNRGFEINKNSTGYVFASASFAEEGIERIICNSDRCVAARWERQLHQIKTSWKQSMRNI